MKFITFAAFLVATALPSLAQLTSSELYGNDLATRDVEADYDEATLVDTADVDEEGDYLEARDLAYDDEADYDDEASATVLTARDIAYLEDRGLGSVFSKIRQKVKGKKLNTLLVGSMLVPAGAGASSTTGGETAELQQRSIFSIGKKVFSKVRKGAKGKKTNSLLVGSMFVPTGSSQQQKRGLGSALGKLRQKAKGKKLNTLLIGSMLVPAGVGAGASSTGGETAELQQRSIFSIGKKVFSKVRKGAKGKKTNSVLVGSMFVPTGSTQQQKRGLGSALSKLRQKAKGKKLNTLLVGSMLVPAGVGAGASSTGGETAEVQARGLKQVFGKVRQSMKGKKTGAIIMGSMLMPVGGGSTAETAEVQARDLHEIRDVEEAEGAEEAEGSEEAEEADVEEAGVEKRDERVSRMRFARSL